MRRCSNGHGVVRPYIYSWVGGVEVPRNADAAHHSQCYIGLRVGGCLKHFILNVCEKGTAKGREHSRNNRHQTGSAWMCMVIPLPTRAMASSRMCTMS